MATSAKAHGRAMHMDDTTRTIQFASYTFDNSVEEIFTTLQHGGTVCVPSDSERLHDIGAAMARYGVTWADLTPTVASLIRPEEVPSLKTLCLGGEAVNQDVVSTWAGKVELINGYGPAEACVTCICSTEDLAGPIRSTNIGIGVGCNTWVVDTRDSNRLAPIGTVGELLIEGPILARGYLNDPERTDAAFITNPAWAIRLQPGIDRQLYKTNDLVRYTSQGSLIFIGRSDSQVKIRGQRVELGDIEWNLSSFEGIEKAIVVWPTQGQCSGQLVAVVTLKSDGGAIENGPTLTIRQNREVKAAVGYAMEWVVEHLPSYMVPQVWAVVNRIPLLPSGKLDRKSVIAWVDEMGKDVFNQLKLSGDDHDVSWETATTPAQQEIQILCADLLNKTPGEIILSRSFIGHGGDSISAMKLSTMARKAGWTVSVQSILRAKSLAGIASQAKPVQTTMRKRIEEQENVAFELSPIQKLTVELSVLSTALDKLVAIHSMLRTRFSKSSNGFWQQRVISESSCHLDYHHIGNMDQLEPLMADMEANLDICNGPIFRASLFDIKPTGSQVLFLVAHHLVVDLISWQIMLRDLESLILLDASPRVPDISYQAWCASVRDRSCDVAARTPATSLSSILPKADLDYWDLDTSTNTFENTTRFTFQLDRHTTSLLIGSIHEKLSTETMDILLSCLNISFKQTFPDRLPCTIFAEGHGRESWTGDINPAETVGWFTVLKPFFLDIDTNDGLVRSLAKTKDTRRSMERDGLTGFASLVDASLKTNPTVEVLFNFLGHAQMFDDKNSLFKPLSGHGQRTDVNVKANRDSIFDIQVQTIDGGLEVQVMYPKHLSRSVHIETWMQLYQSNLQNTVSELLHFDPMPTLADLPLLDLSYDELEILWRQALHYHGITDTTNVEDIYPCSPIQKGMMMSQKQSPDLYHFNLLCELSSKVGSEIDLGKLQDAWEMVVARHPILRSQIIEWPVGSNSVYQLVRRQVSARPSLFFCQFNDNQFTNKDITGGGVQASGFSHELRICMATDKRVFLNLIMNHVFTDGSSMTIILEDLISAYDGILSLYGPQFKNYIEFLQTETDRVEDASFWKEYLDEVTPTYLTAPSPRHAIRELQVQTSVLDLELDEISHFCTSNSVTQSNLFQLAWALVLQAYTGSSDVCFGFLSSGRDAPIEGISRMAGPLINMIIARLALEPDMTILQILNKVKGDFTRMIDHQYLSLADILHLHKNRLQGRPMFNTVMSFQKRDGQDKKHGSSLDLLPVDGDDPTEFDCSVGVEFTGHAISLTLSHWTDKISDRIARHLTTTFETIVASIVRKPDMPIKDMDATSLSQSRQLTEWAHVPINPVDECLHTTFERFARQTPNAEAVCSADGSYTYKELNDISQKLARSLRDEYQIRRNTLVPFCFEKSSLAVVSMIAVLKAGAVNVPINPDLPHSRIKDILEDMESEIVIASSKLAPLFQGLAKPLVLDETLLSGLEATMETVCPALEPSDAAYIIFTSGSTGHPKGIVLEHRNLATACTAQADALGITSHSRILQFASYHFDMSLSDHWYALTRGACVCIPTEEERFSDLSVPINRMKVDTMFVTPTVADLVDETMVPTLKSITLGGEAVTKHIVDKWTPILTLNFAYGPAEISVFCCWRGNVKKGTPPSSIGRPLNCRIWLTKLDDPNMLVPVGCIGELCVEGPQVSRCYFKDAERTKSSFVNNPDFLKGDNIATSRRIYRTGDLARYNDDGTLVFAGRKDNQVKLHGQRLELEDIEYNLSTHDAIRHGLVVLPTKGPARNKLIAVITLSKYLANTEEPSLRQLSLGSVSSLVDITAGINYMSSRLPAYMVPPVWIVVNAIPMSPTGKLFRKKVLDWVSDLSDLEYQSVIERANAGSSLDSDPTDSVEIVLQNTIADVLGLPISTVGLGRSFMSLGGDSISAIQAVSRCKASGVTLTVKDILKSPSIRGIAAVARNSRVKYLESTFETDVQFTLTPIQQLYAQKINSNGFQQHVTLKVADGVTSVGIKASLEKLIDAHPMLHSRLVANSLAQVIDKEQHVSFMEATIDEHAELVPLVNQLRLTINQDCGPMFGALLFKCFDNNKYLFLTAHHLVVDEVSWSIIREDLQSLLLYGHVSVAPTLDFQTWANLQRDYASQSLDPSVIPGQPIQEAFHDYWGPTPPTVSQM
ncbi:Nonribosomal peptide synthetase 8 [Fusarium culmorum]|uniref:Nonribosomal peptide synthetase 8 n=1 Tax=Fusarium culmorum TaxID=5516 RepID=A0A2T4GGY0_FUSCU|nr:Nonribosomal peptide synthetase 8 [Fusarium culmorum]